MTENNYVVKEDVPASTRHWTNAGLMLGQRRRRWANISRKEGGEVAYKECVKERICGEKNMWHKMTKITYFGWSAGCKTIKVDVRSKEMMKTSNSMMTRFLVITA